MARLGASKKKKRPRATELSQLKKELQDVYEQLESRNREQIATSEILRVIAELARESAIGAGHDSEKRRSSVQGR